MENELDKQLMQSYIDGTLGADRLLQLLMPDNEDSSIVLLACRPEDYSASRIAKAVEDCDIQLLGLSLTGMRNSAGLPVVALRVGARSAASVTRSLERYGMEVIFTRSGANAVADHERQRAAERAAELLHYLEM